jgi:hypothetical protein
MKAAHLGISAEPDVVSLSRRVEATVREVYERKFAAEAFRDAKAQLDRLRASAKSRSEREVVQGGYNDLATAKRVAATRPSKSDTTERRRR